MSYIFSKNNKTAKAFTIAEMVIAFSVTAIIALISTTFTVSMMNSRNAVEEQYQLARSSNIVITKIEEIIRSSQLVLQCDSNCIMLWTADEDDYGLVNLSEIAIIEYSSDDQKMYLYSLVMPDWATPAEKNMIDPDTTLNSAMNWTNGSTPLHVSMYGDKSVVAENVTSATFTADQAVPATRRISINATVSTGSANTQISLAAALRRDISQYVNYSGASYFLDPEYTKRNPAFADISNVMAN